MSSLTMQTPATPATPAVKAASANSLTPSQDGPGTSFLLLVPPGIVFI